MRRRGSGSRGSGWGTSRAGPRRWARSVRVSSRRRSSTSTRLVCDERSPMRGTARTPAAILDARSAAAAAALRRLLGDDTAERLAAEVVPALETVIDRGVPAGRPLFAAQRGAGPSRRPGRGALARRDDAPGAPGRRARRAPDRGRARRLRGARAVRRVRGRRPGSVPAEPGLVTGRLGRGRRPPRDARTRHPRRRAPTPTGQALRARDRRADRRARRRAVRRARRRRGRSACSTRSARRPDRIAAAGEIMFPNPMGLPASSG